ncbi:uncharacterized protein JN550_010518 [Neoarthrinium moseri]|uniref:uncharacterized protein n=1 Tax=Neoarthrinium moseri TaxID=1658444 RepID=UPI001FDAF4B2|nr:uncharacterized protein JN550_010518 [Neoarthrinium moseri]KAI1862053.1 hypothetical protein JN550_010518 [Neoarthrinium moseri]
MPATPRQKACIACADSKRKCDKQLPECRRCLDRDVDCVYPQRKRRHRVPVPRHSQPAEPAAILNFAHDDGPQSNVGFGHWGSLELTNVDPSLLDVVLPYVPTLPTPYSNLSAGRFRFEDGSNSDLPCPWFLEDETWVLRQCNQEVNCVTNVQLEPLIHAVEEMLQSWVKNGFNSFIHRRLYENGMPTCLQDAFTTLAAYTSRTSAVKEIMLQITEDRASALVASQNPPSPGSAQSIPAHLARVQSLFIYEFILLFDGSVRGRASAEKKLPVLRRWMDQMWQLMKRYRVKGISSSFRPLRWTATEFDTEYDAYSEMWKLWILVESVRRSHLIIDTIANVYQTMTKGSAECSGAAMFTARRGVWEAESAAQWFELCCSKSTLLVPSLQPEPLISQYAAEEIDDFAKLYWTFIVGSDKMQCWKDRRSKESRINITTS